MLINLYKPLRSPIVITDIKSAELIKHASNAYLATKISFINAVSRICEKSGADVVEVAHGMGLDKRIGPGFLNAGLGYGGSCFPKDLDAFINISEKLGYNFELLKVARNINQQQRLFFLDKIKDALWIIKDKTIGILGLSFKPSTDDIRNAPSIDLIKALQAEGANIKAYDPQAMERTKEAIDKRIVFCKGPYDACKGSDCLLIVTEWQEFKELDFSKIKKLLKRPIIIDGRNIYEPQRLEKLGFIYIGMGRGIVSKSIRI
jgi:UDPglucose 6-dehydrogenase